MSVALRRAIYGKLAGDSVLTALLSTSKPPGRNKNIFHSFAPDGGGTPYVIFSKSAGTPVYTMEPRHPATWGTATVVSQAAYDNELWLVKGVAHDGPEITAEDPMNAADTIAARVDWLLTNGTLDISGASSPPAGTATVFSNDALFLRRESDVEYAETSDGEVYYHSGALYRLIYSAAT